MFKPKLSIITIVYNDVRHINRTIQSIIAQTYQNIEYVIIDGGSNDGTLKVLEANRGHITTLVSEPDKGIYDAMNKGLAIATGEYVLFMNSGDELFDADTVAAVFATAPDGDIYYGETEMINENGESLGRRRHSTPEQFNFKSFKYGMSVSHQAIYIRRSITTPYDPRYQLSADIDWILKAVKKSNKIVNVHRYVAKYLVGGMSKKKHKQSLIERFNIMRENYGLLPTIINHAVIAFNLGWYWLKNRKTND